MQPVDHASGGYNCGAMLIIMEDGDVQDFAQALLYDKTFRCLDVLQIDTTEGFTEEADAINKLVDIFCVDF